MALTPSEMRRRKMNLLMAMSYAAFASSKASAWSPTLLFAAGEQGAWYDPSDFLPNWRLNLLTYTEQFDNVAWVASLTGVGTVTKSTTNAGEAPDGTTTADRVIFNLNGGTATTDIALLRQNNATTGDLTFSIAAKSFDGTSSYAMQIIKPDGTAQSITVTGTWQRFSVTGTASGAVNYGLRLRGGQTPTNSNTADILVWGADLRLTSNASVSPTYQKITDGVQDYLTYQPQPVMFQDSAGTTPVTAVEQPVGLLLDKSKGLALGAELRTATATPSGGWTQSGGVVTAPGTSGATDNVSFTLSAATVAGRFYEVSIPNNMSSNGFYVDFGSGTGSQVGALSVSVQRIILTCTAPGAVVRVGRWVGSPSGTIGPISVKELPGNHASQSTSASRPVLSARVNLLTYSEQFDNAAWTNASPDTPTVTANNLVAPDGTTTGDTLTAATGGIASQARQSINVTGALAYTFSVFIKQGTSTQSRILVRDQTNGLNFLQTTALTWSSGVPVIAAGNGTWTTPVSVGNGWWRIAGTGTAGAGASVNVLVSVYPDNSAGTGSLGVWGADLRVTNDGVGLPAYQRVAAATDYDTSGFPLYLKFDGTDDSLATGTIDFSATDKMTVHAGVRKLSSSVGMVSELYNAGGTNRWFLYDSGTTYQTQGGGSLNQNAISGTTSAPASYVLTSYWNIPAPLVAMRLNTVETSSTVSQGTGNFGNYPLYIGSRAGTSLWMNKRLYSLIVRGALSTDAQIASTETWVNGKTGAY